MSYQALNGVWTQDAPIGYTLPGATTMLCPGAARINIEVEHSPIYYEFGDGKGGVLWRGHVRMAPGFRSFDQTADAVRVWSATPGQPALVTVAAFTPQEIGQAPPSDAG